MFNHEMNRPNMTAGGPYAPGPAAAPTDASAGNVGFWLGADYENICYLGDGGMGTLFRAHKHGLGVEVVIKKVKSDMKGRVDESKEANILKGLKHKYLPRIYDIITGTDGYCYTVMDYIPGCNLQEYVMKNGALDQQLAYKWACQLCEAVDYLHTQKKPVIHCDIKPSNVMITPDGDICLIDFNTSLIFHNGVLAEGATPGYAAPEQYTTVAAVQPEQLAKQTTQVRSYSVAQTSHEGNYGSISTATDVYGIGATMYFMLTGYHPARSRGPVTPLTEYDIYVGDAMLSIIRCAMEKEQKKRFANAGEMLRALHNIRKYDKRYKRYLASCRIAVVLLLLALLGGIASLSYGVFLMRQESEDYYTDEVANGIALSEASEYEKSYAVLSDAIRLSENRIEAYNGMAILLYRQSKYEECITLLKDKVYELSARSTSENAQSYANVAYLLANCYYELGEYDAAVEQYESAIYYMPENTSYYRDLAITQARNGSLSAARQTMSQLSGIADDEIDVQLVQGEIYAASGDSENAIRCFEQVLNQSNDMQVLSRTYILSAQAYRKLGSSSIDDEIAMLEQAVNVLDGSLNMTSTELLFDAYARKAEIDGQNSGIWYAKALACIDSLDQRGQTTKSLSQSKAVLLENMDRFDEAEAVLQQLCSEYPNDYSCPMRLALLGIDRQSTKPVEQRDYHEVNTYYEKAKELYAGAQAVGTDDAEMTRLENLIRQLRDGGWAM